MGFDKAFFSPRAVKANEDAVRKAFAPLPGDDAELLCRSRVGQRVAPVTARALLDEINRGTPVEILQPAYLSVLAWAIAGSVAAVPSGEERMIALGQAFAFVEATALSYALGDTVTPSEETHGEIVGGHA